MKPLHQRRGTHMLQTMIAKSWNFQNHCKRLVFYDKELPIQCVNKQ